MRAILHSSKESIVTHCKKFLHSAFALISRVSKEYCLLHYFSAFQLYKAVSYTHLDVYKRQIQRRLNTGNTAANNQCALHYLAFAGLQRSVKAHLGNGCLG